MEDETRQERKSRGMTRENLRRTAYFVWGRIPSRLREGENFFSLYILLLILVGAYYLVRWPIVFLDADLWYHMNGGRYIAEHWRIPTESFFSFLSPPRAYVDYYWLFQVLVYSIYKSRAITDSLHSVPWPIAQRWLSSSGTCSIEKGPEPRSTS